MLKRAVIYGLTLLALWTLASAVAGWWLMPPLLLGAPLPVRTEEARRDIRARLALPGSTWERLEVKGGEDRPLEVWWLRRPRTKGVVLFLHGFGDDAWGTLPRAAELPDWDAVGFTFRGRDRHPEVPCTLGAWEKDDVVAVVAVLEGRGVPRGRMVLAAWSMGAGTALLALKDLEAEAGPLGGALLECPFEHLRAAARDHVGGTLGKAEPLARLAEWVAVARGGRLARFHPDAVSPVAAAAELETPIALVTGDADRETPLEGVRRIARHHPDLTIVAGAGHCEASGRLPGGWKGWAEARLTRWRQ